MTVKLSGITHRNGGDITAVHAVGHETWRGVADWFFICAVTWHDGTKSERAIVSPNALCYEEGNKLGAALNARLVQYLEDAGEWHEAKEKRDGRIYHWTPHNPKGKKLLHSLK
jgi:hypothetical protein